MKKIRNLLFLLILILCISSIYIFLQKTRSNNVKEKELKEKFNYTYKIDNSLNVKAIIGENKLIVQEGKNLLMYNINRKKNDAIITSIQDGYNVSSVNSFDDGIVWVETRNQPSISTKIYIKYFKSDKVVLLDETVNNILPNISISSKYMTYYIVNENYFNIKIVDLESQQKKIIASYESSESKASISPPSINHSYIVWSYVINNKSTIFMYDILSGNIDKLPSNELVYNPVLKNDHILAIKENIYYDDEIKNSYSSNYIVEFEPKS